VTPLELEPRSREQITTVANILRDVLGDAAIAAYLYGSAVVGGLRPGSDLDVFVVTTGSLTAEERPELVRRLLPISGRGAIHAPARSLEVSVVAQRDVRPWRYPPTIQFQYGDWMRGEFERGQLPDWPHPDPDVAVLIETAHVATVPLFGPPVGEVLDRVPRDDLVRAMVDAIPVLMPGIETGDDTRNCVLTFARIWTTLATGEIRPKDAAADCTLSRLPEEHRPVLAHARAIYRGEAEERWDGLLDRVRPHVDYVVEQITSLAGDRRDEGDRDQSREVVPPAQHGPPAVPSSKPGHS
jgi:predicted nucleotidyltransferase